MAYDLEFGFGSSALDVQAGPITIETLVGLEDKVAAVKQSGQQYQDWIYAPLQPITNLGSGETNQAP